LFLGRSVAADQRDRIDAACQKNRRLRFAWKHTIWNRDRLVKKPALLPHVLAKFEAKFEAKFDLLFMALKAMADLVPPPAPARDAE